MKIIRFLGVLGFFLPATLFAAPSADFQNASRLLAAARRGDTQTVQFLVNRGANVNYVDSTGMSLVCTAVMNNDTRAIQVLQMYGADASNCDRQIKNYKQKTRVATRGEEYGFFSGLSSSHILALSAVGVAAVIGGVALLTDAFDAENDNIASSSGGSHSGSGGGGGGGTTTSYTTLFSQNLPYGPACSNGTCPTDFSTWETMPNFAYMSQVTDENPGRFNYLMVARAYNAFIRGYLGMTTIRLSNDLSPYNLSSLPFVDVPGGGKPINVAMITASGVDASLGAVDGLIPWVDSDKITTVQSICNTNGSSSAECQEALAAATNVAHKYYNYSGADAAPTEDTSFNLSGSGSVFGNATPSDTKLAKIIAGWNSGGSGNDFYGFISNGQLTVYKTGTNHTWTTPPSGTNITGSYNMDGSKFAVGDTLTVFAGTELTISSVSGNNFTAIASTNGKIYNGYTDGGKLYIDSAANGVINQMYTMGAEDTLTLTSIIPDYKNYYAIANALQLRDSKNNYVTNVVANLSLPDNSVNLDYPTVAVANIINASAENEAQKQSYFGGLIDKYYNLDTTNDATVSKPSADAESAFGTLAINQKHLLINSAGRSIVNQSLSPQDATFENFAPVVYSGLQNLFATVVAVSPSNTTANLTVNQYNESGAGSIVLSTWKDPDDSSITYYSRMCGLTGTGNGGSMNPWCFAAPGSTDMEATAAMAGSVALVKSAFTYMSPQEIFLLLALTADGPYLGINPKSSTGYSKWTADDNSDLIEYLRGIYTLPDNLEQSDAQYLQSFKTAFGYGLINLERATRPTTNVYFYSSDTNSIVSASGKSAFWGKVTSSSSSSSSSSPRLSTVLNGRGKIRTAFYDVLESADGTLSLPRVWNMEFDLGKDMRHSLYMGDVLGEFAVDSANKHSRTIDNMTFDMAMSPRAYNDNMNGLDNLSVSFSNEKYDLNAEYQHYLTDGQSRFDGRANGILALVSNGMSSGAKYKFGNFAFGARAFSGVMSDENLLENDPVVSAQFEPARLGLANGGAMDVAYNNDKFGFDVSFGNMHETNTVLGALSDGLLSLNGANTQYVDVMTNYRPIEKLNLFARATFANTHANVGEGFISDLSNIKSNAFALGADMGGFNFTAAMPLAVVDGRMGYDYADFSVVENDGKYTVAMNNPHVEYIDLVPQKRELRFSGSYKQSLGEFTDAGIGFIYRMNPGNTDVFGNESIFMFKLHHRLGI